LVTALNIHQKLVEIIEEHKTVGFPFKCSGLINARLFERLNIGRRTIQNKLCGTIVVSPSGKIIQFNLKEYIGYVINRPEFEREILLKLGNNVKIYTSKKIGSPRQLKGYDLVIGADGAFSTIRAVFGFPFLQYAYGVQYEIKCSQKWPKYVTIFIDKSYTDYHVWNVPVDETRARVGLACEDIKSGFKRLDDFLLKKIGSFEIVNEMVGAIPVGYLEKITANDLALVGDAAGQNRPLSGGGLNLAIKYGQLLGQAVDRDNLQEYENVWRETDLQKNKREMKMLLEWKKLSNSQIEKAIENMPVPDFKESTFFTAIFKSIIEGAYKSEKIV